MKRRWWYRWRSAITGRFTSKAKGEAAPDTTVRERAGWAAPPALPPRPGGDTPPGDGE